MQQKSFVYFMRGTRERVRSLEQQLGSQFNGVLSSDDFSVYNGYPVTAQQKCLAHLRRHFKKVVKLGLVFNPAARRFLQGGRNPLELSVGHHELSVLYQGSALPVDGIDEGEAFLDLIDEAFAQHRQWRETQDEAAYRTWAVDFKSRVAQSLQQWRGLAGYEAGFVTAYA